MDLMTQAFYLPNVEDQKKRYEQQLRRPGQISLSASGRTFPPLRLCPSSSFPSMTRAIFPFSRRNTGSAQYVNFNDPVIDRYFFRDLDKPVLARDVFSQYQLEYLNDNVRKSEWVGRENHIYLHYTDWTIFCAYLQCLEPAAPPARRRSWSF